MMERRVIDGVGLNHFVSSIIEHGCAVVAPQKESRRVLYRILKNSSEFLAEPIHAQNSPKDFLFPRSEELLYFTEDGDIIEAVPKALKTVFLGVRPCDAMALKRLDKLFNWDYFDVHYHTRRGNSILIGLACNHPLISCFCTSLEGGLGPHQKEHVDIMMTNIGKNSYLIDPVSEVGGNLMSLMTCSIPAEPIHEKRALKLKETAEKMITKDLALDKVFEVLNDNFESAYWKDVSRKCIGCGICTYVCPTCHCFDIQDEETSRIRFWDSCQFALYSKHANAYNPRDQPYKRLRNRVYHKFVYFQKNLDEPLCVGCGRCTNYCPMKVDIFKLVSEAEIAVSKYMQMDGSR